MTTIQHDTKSSPKPNGSDNLIKEFFSFLFKKRIGKAWGWIISKLDAYLSDDTPLDGRSARVAAQESNNDFSMTQLGDWGNVLVAGFKMLLLPAKKLYQYYKWRKNPQHKKPVFTASDAFYLSVDIALFALTITAVVLASKFIAVVLGFGAAVVTVISGVVEFTHAWKNRKNYGSSQEANSQYLKIAKRTLSLALPSMGLVAAGLVLLGTLLGPVGIPLITVGLGIGVGVTILAGAAWVAEKVDNYIMNKIRLRKVEAYLLQGDLHHDNTLTPSEKISRMFEIQRFLSKNMDYDDKRYKRFFKNNALVNALKNSDYREQFQQNLQDKQMEVSRELLKERPLSEKKEIPLEVIIDHVIANPHYAKKILSKRYGTTLFGRRNFRKELSERMDLVLMLKAAATVNPELREAIQASTLENSRHFKKQGLFSQNPLGNAGVFSHKL